MAVIPFSPEKKSKKSANAAVGERSGATANHDAPPNKKHRADFAGIGRKAAELARDSSLGSQDSVQAAEDLLMSTLGTLYSFLATFSDGDTRRVDIEAIDKDLFNSYIREFPCFWTLSASYATSEIVELYLADQLNDSQDLAVEAVLELSSQYGFNFTLADAFGIWASKDREAFLRVFEQHHKNFRSH